MASPRFQTGLDTLLTTHSRWLRGKQVGLLAHPASVDRSGLHAAVRLRAALGKRLAALFGPEHGFHGRGGAGEHIRDERHPVWGIPIHSLYGAQRRPSTAMLDGLDVLVFDLQDLAVRCYTFVTTLRYVLEAAAETGVAVIVCDRPVPLPGTVDGPMLDPAFTSFVAGVPAPLVYGMTPGEAARWLKAKLKIDVDLRVAPLRGYDRAAGRGAWGPWISPSPGIRYWETAWSYPAIVPFEALPAVDFGRGGTQPFQVITAPFFDAEKLAAALNKLKLDGVQFLPVWNPQPGVRFQVTAPARFRPFATSVAVLHTLQKLYGVGRLWGAPGTRPEFFDQLMGTNRVRLALQGGTPWRELVVETDRGLSDFRDERDESVLYRAVSARAGLAGTLSQESRS